MARLVFLWLIIAARAAQAQIGLPDVRLPALPQVPLSDNSRLLSATAQSDLRALRDVRRLRVRDLIRRNRESLEADRNGAAIVRGEILVVSPSESELDTARSLGFTILRIRVLDGLDARIVVLGVPQGMETLRALAQLRTLQPSLSFDVNHVYTDSGPSVDNGAGPARSSNQLLAEKEPSVGGAGTRPEGHESTHVEGHESTPAEGHAATARERLKIGLIDSGVDVAHPVFRDIPIHQYGCSGAKVPDKHGTAVASLMTGRSVDFRGAAPGSELYAADVYCGLPTGGAADAVADAFAWLARERVPVINVSLVGPPNTTLEAVIHIVIARGQIIVAAVGNDGPAAPPLYPASYPGVVGVTAVDTHRHVLFEAGRGPQVRFAAPGADMSAAKSLQAFELVRGTSFAAPIVAGLLAAELRVPNADAAARAIDDLAHRAIDLGAAGVDPVYGFGLVGSDLAPEPRLAKLHPP